MTGHDEGHGHAHGRPADDAERLQRLEDEVGELRAYRDRLSFRVKVAAGVIAALGAIAGFDAFATKILRAELQSYLGVTTPEKVTRLVWDEMADQVATSYGATFTLGTLDRKQGAETRRYVTLPFFAPSSLKGVVVCFNVTHSGRADPTGIEVRLDGSPPKTVAAPPIDEEGHYRQHECLDDLAKVFGARPGAGALEHVMSFALERKEAVEDRKDVTVLINVVGELRAHERREP